MVGHEIRIVDPFLRPIGVSITFPLATHTLNYGQSLNSRCVKVYIRTVWCGRYNSVNEFLGLPLQALLLQFPPLISPIPTQTTLHSVPTQRF